ncbi:hypothetical protein [Streptomyces sp. NPDC047315]|uniref:hypothetical protein n=1 Tax=Streptomyces sp. NPDC047315 TaxID=3155142 RepID=UPI0033D7162E
MSQTTPATPAAPAVPVFAPPVYEWAAGDAQEAEAALTAARELIDAHLSSLHPAAGFRPSVRRGTPLSLVIRLDLTRVVEAITQAREVGDGTSDAAPSVL